ncbi:MAG: O-antigen ligase family protein [Candidatus Daviesbacteria bacterium]|nr:O-antigen ligase family protein [Candidatus Daviesbacteria bacterium]
MSVLSWTVVLAISIGQLIKIPFGEGGVTILDLLVGCLALMNLGSWLLVHPKPTFDKNLINLASLGFILVAVISLIFSPIQLTSSERLIAASYIIRLGAFFSLLWFPNKLLSNLAIEKILIFSGVIIATLGLLQLVAFPDLQFLAAINFDPHYLRTVSSLLDPNFTGAFLSLTAVILWPKLFTKKILLADLLIFGLIYITLLTTFSRGGYLAFGAGLLTISILQKSPKQFILSVILTGILLFSFKQYNGIVAVPRKIDRGQSAAARLDTWQQGFDIFGKYPILGVGFNTYRFALRDLHLADEQFLEKRGASTNDSSLLYVASTTGVIGLGFYLAFLMGILKLGWRLKKSHTRGVILIGGLAALLAQSFFANTLFYPFLLIWLILYLNSVFYQSK